MSAEARKSSNAAADDAAMLAEIKEFLQASKRSKLDTKGKIKAKPSPYNVDLVKSLPSSDFDNIVKKPPVKRRKKVAIRQKLPTDPDDLLNYYASLPRYKHPFTKDEMDVKALTLPFKDSMLRIEKSVDLQRSVRKESDLPSRANLASTGTFDLKEYNIPQDSPKGQSISEEKYSFGDLRRLSRNKREGMSRFHRKYPRVCQGFRFTDEDVNRAQHRSDFWMIRFMEECYDEAYKTCETPVSSEARWRLRNGLDLGSMDAFPLVVQRLLAAKYSVLEVRRQIFMEFLHTMQHYIDVSEQARYKEVPGYSDAASAVPLHAADVMFDGGRAQLFAKFLSEEYELDFLALFLQKRLVIQTAFGFRLRDLTQSRIWVDEVAISSPLRPTRHREKIIAANTTAALPTAYQSSSSAKRRHNPLTKRAAPSAQAAVDSRAKLRRRGSAEDTSGPGPLSRRARSASAAADRFSDDEAELDKSSVSAQQFEAAANAFGSRSAGGLARLKQSEQSQPHRGNRRKEQRKKGEEGEGEGEVSRSGVRGVLRSQSAVQLDGAGRNNCQESFSSHTHVSDLTAAAAAAQGPRSSVDGDWEKACSQGDSKGRKMVPVPLPSHWHFVRDVGLREAPLLGFEGGLLSLLCMILLPQCPTSLRTYMSDRVLDACSAAIVESAFDRAASTTVSLNDTGAVILASTTSTTNNARRIAVIPLYLLLQTLCLEWKKLPAETKASLGESLSSGQSLKQLNVIYENDCQLIKAVDRRILEAETALGSVQAHFMALDKTLRRLERKRKGDIATNLEMVDIEDTTSELNAVQLTM